ncbi:agmatinase [Patescibacteria group bacterium]|nr:agmatinase [Patescibacteria group bacterium]MBU0964646.1 agmatinase [Patescibacteria group bacterium]
MRIYKEKEAFTFCGYDNPPFKKAKAIIVPIPHEATLSYKPGTSQGPQAIINASRHMETYDIELGLEIFGKAPIHTLEQMESNFNSPEEMINEIERSISKLLTFKKFPVILGGEHSITTGIVRAFKRKYSDLTVIQLDAHADLRDQYQGTHYSHASPMRRCREIANVIQVGIRSMSEDEAEYINKNKIKNIYYSPELSIKEILKNTTRNVYLTIDLDVLNPALMPAVGTPEPGGLTWYPFINFIKEIFKQRNVVGADVVELSPIPGIVAPDFMAAVIVYKLIGYKFFGKMNAKSTAKN